LNKNEIKTVIKKWAFRKVDIKIEKVHKTIISQSEAKQVSKWYYPYKKHGNKVINWKNGNKQSLFR
jgi:hypothetical protein